MQGDRAQIDYSQIDALDGLRGVAVLLVIFSHCSNNGWFLLPGMDLSGVGKVGVFLFFILSSYLLSFQMLVKGRAAISKSYMVRYWSRRFLRIYPLYLLYLLLGLFSGKIVHEMTGVFVSIPFDLNLIELARHLALMDGKGVTWSIAVEFKFYFMLPFIMALLVSAFRLRPRFAVFCLVFCALLISYFYPPVEAERNSTKLFYYMPIFMFGIVVAIINYNFRSSFISLKIYLRVLLFCCFLLILVTIPSLFSNIFFNIPVDYFHREYIFFSFLWSVVLLYVVNYPGRTTALLSAPVLKRLGTLSFGIYLIHPIIIKLFRYFDAAGGAVYGVVILTVMAAHFSYKYFELPMLRLASKIKI
jgi:peptidoglycan/LPS O-acetylase OafA/YrhL